MDIKIEIPDQFTPERTYSLNVLFAYFKDVKVHITSVANAKSYHILLPNNRSILIEDHFWNNKLDEQEPFYSVSQIPKSIHKFSTKINNQNYPLVSIYGGKKIEFTKNQITLSTDIVSSTFFMLSRWEEYISKHRDKHDRFPDGKALAIKEGIYDRPIVNEYIDFLKNAIESLTDTKIEYNRSYHSYITHDIDEIYRFKPLSKWINTFGADLIRRKSINEAYRTLSRGFISKLKLVKDDSDTFDYFMDISEKYGLKSRFYFIPGFLSEPDVRYDIRSKAVKKIISHILDREHIIGIHPSYQSKESYSIFKTELDRLRKVDSEILIQEGRHHYLRFNYPNTLRYWESSGIAIDSSFGFHNHVGFRCGICYEFPIFDILERRTLNLIERPLIVMDVALIQEYKNEDNLLNTVSSLHQTIYKYQGDFVYLWHNNNINHPFWRKKRFLYERIIKIISNH